MKRNRAKRPSRLDELTIAARQDHSHLHSESIRSKRELIQFEISQLQQRLVALNAAVKNATTRMAELNAVVVGLDLTLENRR